MATAGDLNKVNGDILYAADVTALLNSQGSIFNDVAQMIFNAEYTGWDSSLTNAGEPSLDNVQFDIFTGDTADTTTQFTYNSSDDMYELDFDATEAILVIGFDTDVGENITNAIPIVNYVPFYEYSDETGIVLNPDFETGDRTSWGHSSSENNDFESVVSSGAYEGTYCWRMGVTTDGWTGTSQTMTQTVDLTGVVKVTARIKRATSNSDNENYSAGLAVTGCVGDSRSGSTMTGGWDLFEVFVPRNQRIPGRVITLSHGMGNPKDYGNTMYYDDVRTIGNELEIVPVIEFSNDGATFETCTLKKIHNPTTTGQKAQIKMTVTPSGAAEYVDGYVTECAVKHNLY